MDGRAVQEHFCDMQKSGKAGSDGPLARALRDVYTLLKNSRFCIFFKGLSHLPKGTM